MENIFEMEATSLARQSFAALPEHLTPRQLEVLALLCEGLSNKVIGRRLNIASATVKIHVAHILRALHVSSRLQAVLAVRGRNLGARSGEAAPPQPVTAYAPRHPFVSHLLLGDDDASRLLAADSGQSLAAAAG